MSKRNSNIIRYHRSLNINIGLVIFIFILIYLLFNVYTFLTSKHISYVEVDEGSLMVSTTFRALALRDETAVYASSSGRVNYYLKENSKAAKGSLICSIDENGFVARRISETADKNRSLDSETFNELVNEISGFCDRYTDSEFFECYTFKNDLSAELYESANLSALRELSETEISDSSESSFHRIYNDKPGVICYYEDAFENIDLDNFTAGMFDESNYSKKNLKLESEVSEGNMLYKIITDENWYLVIPVDDSVYELLAETSVMRIRFKKDDSYAFAYVSFREKDGRKFLCLSLNNSMIRFLSERYVDVDLLLDNARGLKIANSSIATKELFAVPKKYFTIGGDSNSQGLILSETDDDGNVTDRFVSTDIYGKNIGDDDESLYEDSGIVYYVSESSLNKGSVIKCAENPSDTFVLNQTVSMKGVYNVNKGYAVFRKIEILHQNEEYAIISKKTKYGISMYDHIVLDASMVSEGEII